MTTVTAEIRQLRQLDADTLAGLYCAGQIDVSDLLAIDRADIAADRARARASAERAAWLDAAHAQYLAADAACAGHLLADGASVADELSLWRGSEAWARGQASEELNNFWLDNPRLSLAEYRRQQAMARRAERDARDLAAMPAAPERPERAAPAMRPVSARELATQAARAPRPPGYIARYITALGVLRRQANATRRDLERMRGAIPR